MLELESKLETFGKEVYALSRHESWEPQIALDMLKRVFVMKPPQFHTYSTMIWFGSIMISWHLGNTAAVVEFTYMFEKVWSHFAKTMSPDRNIHDGFYHVGDFMHVVECGREAKQFGIQALQRAIRMSLLLSNRVCRMEKYDERLVQLLMQIETEGVKTVTECMMFCRESPENVTIKLSLCGKCKQVAYCSKGCQKGHWKVHKGHCSK